MARGNHRERIFFENDDWTKFLSILARIKAARPFTLHSYCLMPNHVHLLLEMKEAPISDIMGLILVGYAKYLNAKLERVGHVFQDRFKSISCPRDEYFKHLVRYIHLNPVKAGLVEQPSAWNFSGHNEYLGQAQAKLVDTEFSLGLFNSDPSAAKAAYIQFVLEGLANSGELRLPPPPTSPSATPTTTQRNNLQLPDIRFSPTLEFLEKKIAAEARIEVGQIKNRIKVPAIVLARKTFICSAFRVGHSPSRIAAHLQMSRAAISKTLSRAG